jgi:broad specificity phosphatase PhoE
VVHRARRRVVRSAARRAVLLSTETGVRLYLVRHGRAAAGWDDDPDPPLDDWGRQQAEQVAGQLASRIPGGAPVVSSPLRRCRETAAPLAARWGTAARVEARVAEIPSPEGVPMGERVPWLREAMAGRWADLGPRYVAYRDGIAGFLSGCNATTVVVSHFVAINAAIGVAAGDDRLLVRALDNCSITVVDVENGRLRLVEGGHEADTLIR